MVEDAGPQLVFRPGRHRAIRLREVTNTFLRQDRVESSSFEQAVGALSMLAREAGVGR